MPDATAALRGALLKAGEKSLLFDLQGRSKSGAQIAAAVDRLAGTLARAAGRGLTIGLWYRNSFAALEAFLAVEWVGGTRLPVDPDASADEARRIFEAAGVDLVLADGAHAEALGGGAFIHDDTQPLVGEPRAPVAEIEEDRTFMIYPRSVIDGRLFGIPLAYRNWRAIIATNVALYRSQRYGAWREASEVFLTAQQAMHGTGFLGTFPFLAMGLPQVLVDRFDAAAVLGAIQRHKVTATMLVPAMLNGLLAEAPSDRALGSLRHLLYGGGPMSADDIGAAAQRLGHAMAQVYGRVEGGWPLTVLGPVAHVAMRSGVSRLARSCGRPIAEVSTRLRPLPEQPGDTGELLVKSAMTSADYVGADGWCSLGDVMRRDEEGYLYFERRLDRMINTGYHVYPDEIEAVIRGIGGVAGVRVVGEPHPRWGEMVVAYIVPTAERVEPAQLRQAVAQRLAKYKVPREFRIVDRLPP